jgi:hypothetical protein
MFRLFNKNLEVGFFLISCLYCVYRIQYKVRQCCTESYMVYVIPSLVLTYYKFPIPKLIQYIIPDPGLFPILILSFFSIPDNDPARRALNVYVCAKRIHASNASINGHNSGLSLRMNILEIASKKSPREST